MGGARIERAHALRRRAETHIASAGWLSARELLDEALAIYRQEGDSAGEAACLRGLGDVAVKLDEIAVADEVYGAALVIARAAGDGVAVGDCLLRQGDLRRTQGQLSDARSALEQAAAAYRTAAHRRGEAQCLGLLGEVARASAAPELEVLSLYRDAFAMQMEVGDLRGAAVTLTLLASFLRERDPVAAASAFAQAAELYRGLGLGHRVEPYLAAARKLDPARAASWPVASPPAEGGDG